MILQLSGGDFISMISNVGFPIAAFYLMFRMASTTIKENTEAIHNLSVMIEKSE